MIGPKHHETLEEQLHNTITEARMVLPGVQAILGFQLIAVFNERFARDLSATEQALHVGAFVLVALSTCLLMSPAAHHRIVQRHTVDPGFIRFASRLITAAMLPLAVGLALDAFILLRLALRQELLAAALAVLLLGFFATMWFVLPLVARSRRRQAERQAANAASPPPPSLPRQSPARRREGAN